jgi:uncharacterized membrane protein (DUF4010 family)
MRRVVGFFARTLRAVRFAAATNESRNGLRGLVAIGLVRVSGPFDEAVLLAAVLPLVLVYRAPLRGCLGSRTDQAQSVRVSYFV